MLLASASRISQAQRVSSFGQQLRDDKTCWLSARRLVVCLGCFPPARVSVFQMEILSLNWSPFLEIFFRLRLAFKKNIRLLLPER